MSENLLLPEIGSLRIYDASGTPNYLQILYSNLDHDLPFNVDGARPDEIIHTDRGRADTNIVRTKGPDNQIFDAVTATFSFRAHESQLDYMLAAMSNQLRAGTWTVANQTFVTATSLGNRKNGANSNVACPLPKDGLRAAYLVALEWLATAENTPTNDVGMRYQGVFFETARIRPAGEVYNVSASVSIYGSSASITSHTAGTDATA